MNAGPRIDSYEWSGGREAMLRWGPAYGPIAVLALPLFEEANRTRAFGVSILRALAALGIGGVLPELPGQGESEIVTARATLATLREAFAAVPGGHIVAIRSGALIADEARSGWLLAPQSGPDLLRELARVKGGPLDGESVEVAGNLLSRELVDSLQDGRFPGERRASVGNVRIVRLTTDPQTADLHINGSPLWRRAEPGNDLALAQRLAVDIADWMRACEG